MINADLLAKTMAKIEEVAAYQAEGFELDETWDQGQWASPVRDDLGDVCGTSYCFAGWACRLAGDQIDVKNQTAKTPGAQALAISDRATQLLGIAPSDAADLFEGSNDLDGLRERVADLIAEAD